MPPVNLEDVSAALERAHRLGTIGGDLEEQLAHCASFSSVLEQVVEGVPARGMDLGTGGGLPGVVLAALWADTSWTLVDMREARAVEVERTVARLGLVDRVEVVSGDAQQVAHDPSYREAMDVLVARAFGPASITAECAAGLVRVGGVFVVSEPPEADAERWHERSLVAMGFALPRIISSESARFAVFTKLTAAPDSIPRLPPRSNRGWYQQA